MIEPLACIPKFLPEEQHNDAALAAINENPLNRPHVQGLAEVNGSVDAASIAMVTSKYWTNKGVRLTVGFLDNPEPALRARILGHMNAWARTGNVAFVETADAAAQVRIAREESGYWSYVGTDILLADRRKQTMNLQGFTMATPDSEFFRVVRHETGHTLGCPHEHMRAELVDLIDEAAAIRYFGATQGWSPEQVRAQVLTPIEQASIIGTPADQQSIMCYHIPGALTKNGEPILGGLDIDRSDYDFIGQVYPKPAAVAPADQASTPAHDPSAHRHHHHRDGEVHVALPNGTAIRIRQPLTMPEIEDLMRALRG